MIGGDTIPHVVSIKIFIPWTVQSIVNEELDTSLGKSGEFFGNAPIYFPIIGIRVF
jgi:hypothetical protein